MYRCRLFAGLLLLGFFCASFQPVLAQPVEVKAQLFGWLVTDEDAFSRSGVGLRYLPTLSWEKLFGPSHGWDVELAADGFVAGSWRKPANGDHAELYRGWLRYRTPRLELRAGLQKLDFGPAILLRSLRWFDRVDPRDPLQLTDGVKGLLGRYYFPNNANLWLWGLYDNGRKGLEGLATVAGEPEFGGRFQYPLGKGEMAVTTHFRKADQSALGPRGREPVSEARLAFDGKWDLGAALWFEAVLVHQENDLFILDYRRFLTLGVDQTLPVGNGLHVLAEHLRVTAAEQAFGSGQRADISALSADYHTGLFNSYLAIVTWDWENRDYSASLRWGRVYDRWSFYLNGFRNPDQGANSFPGLDDADLNQIGGGKGIQLLIVFNH